MSLPSIISEITARGLQKSILEWANNPATHSIYYIAVLMMPWCTLLQKAEGISSIPFPGPASHHVSPARGKDETLPCPTPINHFIRYPKMWSEKNNPFQVFVDRSRKLQEMKIKHVLRIHCSAMMQTLSSRSQPLRFMSPSTPAGFR